MLRHEVAKVISQYTPEVLPVFADRFERWPVGDACLEIISHLEKSRAMYERLDLRSESDECQEAIESLKTNMKG